MRFVTFEQAAAYLRGKTVAIVGSAPSVLDNRPGFVDSHDVVVRVNNYKTGIAQGKRCDVHYSFYGNSIRKTREELQRDGVRLCMCKCPDAKPLQSDWHEKHFKQAGIDFRYIYSMRGGSGFWFCDTYVPDAVSFMAKFDLLRRHIPTTGFAAILDVLACEPRAAYLTGFDFFASGIHNIDEKWRPGDPEDPIGHKPALEMRWLRENRARHPVTFDAELERMVEAVAA